MYSEVVEFGCECGRAVLVAFFMNARVWTWGDMHCFLAYTWFFPIEKIMIYMTFASQLHSEACPSTLQL